MSKGMLQSQNILTMFSYSGSGLYSHSEPFFALAGTGGQEQGLWSGSSLPLLLSHAAPCSSLRHPQAAFRTNLPGLSMGHTSHRALPVQLQGSSVSLDPAGTGCTWHGASSASLHRKPCSMDWEAQSRGKSKAS